MNNFIRSFLDECSKLNELIDINIVDKIAERLKVIRSNNGRIFFIGVGGSAANCSHAANDFRKLCEIECYAITDNVSELTARINDEGWDSSFSNWLKTSKLNDKDCIFILSVGGGSVEKKISLNIVEAIKYAKKVNSKIFGIVGPNGGYTEEHGDYVLKIPIKNNSLITPLSESYQVVIWHLLVSHPVLKINNTKW
tara:strand:- start:790 stop:1377 length:588 start_codon:yes stop_codon:yes gene_type:complete